MYLNKKSIIQKTTRNLFFNNYKNKEELEESMFDLWKSELQNNLPEFWESINKK
jgi:hypothetical protein